MALTDTAPAPRPPGSARPALTAGRPIWPTATVIGGYFLLAVIAYWPVLPGISGRLSSDLGDLTLTTWFLAWVPHALAHGLDPFFSNAMFAPSGVNLAQNTEAPLLGLVMAPVTVVFGPVVSANVLMFVSMPVSAAAAFVVLRQWDVWEPAAAIGGLVYGFSPYMIGQGLTHPVLLFVPLPPFIALTVVNILRGRGSRKRLGVQLGLLVAAQYLISPEVLATVGVFTVIAIACAAIRHPTAIRRTARIAARPVAIALGIVAVLLAYPVLMLVAGTQHVVGPTYPLVNPYHNDALSFVVHGPLQRVSFWMPSTWLGAIAGQPTEASAYIGIPVLILVAFFAWRSRRSPRMQLAVVLMIVAALLTLGPYLGVHGHATRFPLPFYLLGHLPLLDNLLPARMAYEMDACLAAILAFGLDDIRKTDDRNPTESESRPRRTSGSRATAVAAVTLVVLVVTLLPRWPYPKLAAVGLPIGVQRAIPTGDPIAVTYPYSYNSFYTTSLLWQADDGFSFRTTGGYAFHPGTNGTGSISPNPMDPPDMQNFLVQMQSAPEYAPFATVSQPLVESTRMALVNYHVRLVIVDRSAPGSVPVMKLFTEALGPPTSTPGHYSLWTDRHGALGS